MTFREVLILLPKLTLAVPFAVAQDAFPFSTFYTFSRTLLSPKTKNFKKNNLFCCEWNGKEHGVVNKYCSVWSIIQRKVNQTPLSDPVLCVPRPGTLWSVPVPTPTTPYCLRLWNAGQSTFLKTFCLVTWTSSMRSTGGTWRYRLSLGFMWC